MLKKTIGTKIVQTVQNFAISLSCHSVNYNVSELKNTIFLKVNSLSVNR